MIVETSSRRRNGADDSDEDDHGAHDDVLDTGGHDRVSTRCGQYAAAMGVDEGHVPNQPDVSYD